MGLESMWDQVGWGPGTGRPRSCTGADVGAEGYSRCRRGIHDGEAGGFWRCGRCVCRRGRAARNARDSIVMGDTISVSCLLLDGLRPSFFVPHERSWRDPVRNGLPRRAIAPTITSLNQRHRGRLSEGKPEGVERMFVVRRTFSCEDVVVWSAVRCAAVLGSGPRTGMFRI